MKKVNKNIEVINEHLWAVNQDFVKMGYIRELTNLPGASPEKHDISLTDQGILVLNNAAPAYEVTRKLLIRIMDHSDEQLNACFELMSKRSNPDSYEAMYKNVLEWEIGRRTARAEYLKSISKPTMKERIFNKIRKRRKVGDL